MPGNSRSLGLHWSRSSSVPSDCYKFSSQIKRSAVVEFYLSCKGYHYNSYYTKLSMNHLTYMLLDQMGWYKLTLIRLFLYFQVVSWIMTIWLFGSIMVFVLARVLGGNVNYSQCLGVIGYSVLPLVLIGLILPLTSTLPYIHSLIKVRMFLLI